MQRKPAPQSESLWHWPLTQLDSVPPLGAMPVGLQTKPFGQSVLTVHACAKASRANRFVPSKASATATHRAHACTGMARCGGICHADTEDPAFAF